MNSDSNTYSLLKKLYNLKIIRYGFAAGTSFLVDLCSYLLFYYVIFEDVVFHFSGLEITSRILSLTLSFSIGFLTNFTISKYFVFKDSNLKTSTQFYRFLTVAVFVFAANWLLMFLLEEYFSLPSGVARFVAGITVAIGSFFSHKFFSFKVNQKNSSN